MSKLDVTYLMCAACVGISVQSVLKISVGVLKGEIRMRDCSNVVAVHLAFVQNVNFSTVMSHPFYSSKVICFKSSVPTLSQDDGCPLLSVLRGLGGFFIISCGHI